MASSSSNRKRKLRDEGRAFNEQWTENYLFIENRGKSVCLVCTETVACLKEYNIKRHYDTKHATTHKKLKRQARQDEIRRLGKQLTGQQMLFQKGNNDCSNILRDTLNTIHEGYDDRKQHI